MGVSFPLLLFLCDILGVFLFFRGTGLGGGQGDACTVPPCAVCGVERTVYTSRHDLHRSHTSNE